MKEFTFKVRNVNQELNKLFKISYNEHNDLYVVPYFPDSKLTQSGFHISFHASGASHLRFHPPVACLGLGPNVKLPFTRAEFAEDVVTKKKTLFTRIDMSNETRGGWIAVLKFESMLRNLFNSRYIRNLLHDRRFIHYYNLVLNNPYRPSSYFKEYFPYKELEIDGKVIQESTYIYEVESLYTKLIEFKNNGIFTEMDIILLMPYEGTFMAIMNGNFMGFKINLNDTGDIINKLPAIRKLALFF